jgi:signal peptidase I
MDAITAENNPFFERAVVKPTITARIVNLLQGLVIVGFMIIVTYQFIVTPNQVHGDSMLPNFISTDVVLTNRLPRWLGSSALGQALGLTLVPGDVLVIETPELPSEDYIIKRLVAVSGDTIMVKGGRVYINGKLLDERDYLPPERRTEAGTNMQDGVQVTVPEGKYAVLGDNRPRSLDSRDQLLGFIRQDRVIGKVIFRFFPFDRISVIDRGKLVFSE